MFDPVPKAALITGAARSIGRAVALRLAREGYAIGIHFHQSRAAAATLAAEIAALGVKSALLPADLGVETAAGGLFPSAQAALGPIGVLVNHAGVCEPDHWSDVTRAGWDRHFEPNLRAPFVLSQAFAAALPATAQGLIINLTDQREAAPPLAAISYSISKAALWRLTQSLALALAPRIRVNAIGSGPRQGSPTRAPVAPAEVAEAVATMLALPSITGQMLGFDGAPLRAKPRQSAAGAAT